MRKGMHDIYKLADYFLSKQSMSNKKLQKLMYYTYSWFLYLNNDEGDLDGDYYVLCEDVPEAWLHGPVFPNLYHKYKEYGYHDIEQIKDEVIIEENVKNLIEQIFNMYKDRTADELEAMTHYHTPWIKARDRDIDIFDMKHCKMVDKEIFEYFAEQTYKYEQEHPES